MPFEVLSWHELHYHIEGFAFYIEVVRLDNAGMAQPRHDLGLAPEALEEPRVTGQVGMDQLDGHIAFQSGVEGFVDLAHPTLAQAFFNLVFADLLAAPIAHH